MDTKTIVIKIGTSSLIKEKTIEIRDGDVNDGNGCQTSTSTTQTNLNLKQIAAVVETCCHLRSAGHKVVLVTSGSVGVGRHCLNIAPKSISLSERQALAAIGQVHLMSQYETFFSAMKSRCAQVLLTYETFRWREQFTNAENTFRNLFALGVIPIVNENDTVATQEIRSENDTMSAMVASLVGADFLFLLTDVKGLYTANPNTDPNAKLISYVEDFHDLDSLLNIEVSPAVEAGLGWGTGGMSVKINAACLAASLGIQTTIMSAENVERMTEFVSNSVSFSSQLPEALGTTFARVRDPPSRRKRWIRGLRCAGSIELDDGAVQALKKRQNIYAVGISNIVGNFPRMAAVKLTCQQGIELGRGLTKYASDDLRMMKGKQSSEIEDLKIGSSGIVIFRKNLAVDFPRDSFEKADSRPERDEKTAHLGDDDDGVEDTNFATYFED